MVLLFKITRAGILGFQGSILKSVLKILTSPSRTMHSSYLCGRAEIGIILILVLSVSVAKFIKAGDIAHGCVLHVRVSTFFPWQGLPAPVGGMHIRCKV
jgi:hypothetical protein